MARLQLDLDRETLQRLADAAARERRPLNWQAEVALRRALGLLLSAPDDGTLCPQSDHATGSSDGYDSSAHAE
jgi:hypothetical protein